MTVEMFGSINAVDVPYIVALYASALRKSLVLPFIVKEYEPASDGTGGA
jgi:hypothetical protein